VSRIRPSLDFGVLGVAVWLLALAACGSDVALGGASDAGGSSDVDATGIDGGGTASSSGASDAGANGGAMDAAAGRPDGGTSPVVMADLGNDFCLGKLAVDATNLYVSAYSPPGAVPTGAYAVPLAGGQPLKLDDYGTEDVAINSTTVYTSAPDPTPQYGVVAACGKSGCGGNSTIIASGWGLVTGVAADDVAVYWSTATNPYDGGNGQLGAIVKAPAGGGPATILATPVAPYWIVPDSGTLFFLAATAPTSAANPHPGVLSMSTDGGALTVIVPSDPSGRATITALTVDAVNVYYGMNEGSVFQVPRSGGTPLMLAPALETDDAGEVRVDGGLAYPLAHQLAVDADRVYFRIGGSLDAVPIGGGAVTTLATMDAHAACQDGVAVDSSHVYWTQGSALMKVAK
jgi:hypothetical protein